MTQDLYYVESGYLTPDAGYYVYTADAEAAVSSASTMAVTVGVIKDCVSTITCQTTVAAVISHIHGADLVAFSNAAIATEINVIRTTNIALTSVFSAAIDAVRGIYVSAQADSTATISIANSRVRTTEAAHSAAFALAADVSVISGVVIKEAEANLSSAFTQTSITGKRQRFEIAQVALSSQNTQAERTRDVLATLVSQSILVSTVGVVKEVVSSQSSEFTQSSSANRTRDASVSINGAFTPTLIADAFKNSLAVLDATSSLTVQSNVTVGYQADLSSQSTVIVQGSIYKLVAASFASEFNSIVVGVKPSRVVGDPTITSGAGYSDLTIDTTTKKFGAGSLRFHSRPSYTSNNNIYVAGNTAVSTSQKQFGAGSIFFDGTGDNISLDFSTDYAFGSGDFTVECWIRPQTLVGTDYIFDLRNAPSLVPVLYLDNGVLKYSNPITVRITGSTLTTNTWYHIALARSGTSTKLFVNGTQVGSTYTDTTVYSAATPFFGSNYQNSVGSNFHGYMDEIRVSNIARYTSNFTAPTAAFTPDSDSLILINGNTTIADSHADWQTVLSVPSVSYPDNSKWTTWKTIDFWLYITPGHPTNNSSYHHLLGQGLVFSSNYWSFLLQGASGFSRLLALSTGAGGASGSASGVSILDNQWNHIRLIKDSGSIVFFLNGTKLYTWTSINLLDLAQPLLFGGDGGYVGLAGTGNVYVDEVFISDVALTSVNDTTFTVPTTPYSNTVDTSLLLHFDSNFFDDASQIPKTLSGVASLTATAVQSTVAFKSVDAVAGLSSTASMTIVAVKNAEIILTAFSDAAVTTNVNRLRSADSSQSSAFTQSIDSIRVRFADSAQSSVFTQDTTAVKTVDSTVTTDAIFTELAAVARTGAGFVQLDVQATMAITAVKTTDVVAPISSEFAQATTAVKSTVSSAALSSATALGTTITRIRNQVLVYAVNSQLEAQVGEIEQFSIDLTAVSILSCETGGVREAFADLSSQSSIDATILRIKSLSSNLSSEFAQTTVSNNSLIRNVAASIAVEATTSTAPGTIKTSAITTDAIFTELAVVAKIGQGFITLDSQATLSAVITKTNGASANIASQATMVAVIGKLQTADSAISSTATLTTTGTFVTTASANFSAAYTLVCNVVKTVNAISLEASAGTLVAQGVATKRTTASISALAFELAVGSRTQTFTANLTAAASVQAKIGGLFQFTAAMQGFAAEVIVADIIHIDAKLTWMIFAEDRAYSIQSENRTYLIIEEDRDYMIVQEDREHAVTRELLTTELQGV